MKGAEVKIGFRCIDASELAIIPYLHTLKLFLLLQATLYEHLIATNLSHDLLLSFRKRYTTVEVSRSVSSR